MARKALPFKKGPKIKGIYLAPNRSWEPPPGSLIRSIIDSTGYTLVDVAELVGFTSNTIQRWVSGKSEINYSAWVLICSLIGTEVEWLKGNSPSAENAEWYEQARKIEHARNALGLSMATVAEQVGVHLRTIYGWERGALPNRRYREKLMACLGFEEDIYTRQKK
jgi:transcriptional regulator with XRE-family HTH domain